MPHILHTLLEEFHEKLKDVKNSVPRKASFAKTENLIKVAIGMRRAGKTYFALQKIQELLLKEIPLESILYINFEDDRLLPMDHKEMGKLLDTFYTLFPENHNRKCFIFLDEVQNVSEWAHVIRRFYDSKNVELYLTGSSAKLLSKEIATSLRGRSIETEIWPFSFSEYLLAHQIEPIKPPLGKKSYDLMRQHLLNFFQLGGFPAVQKMTTAEHLDTLQGYVETVIFRDIVERHQVTNHALLRYFISFLMKNVGAQLSINKFYNDIKSQGHRVGKDTLYNYMDYVQDAYLLFTIPHFSESVREISTTSKKIYAVDNGLLLANTFNLSSNFGKLFENLVYLDLRRQGNQLFYYKTKSGYEIDFIAQSKQGKLEMFQVVWDLEDSKTKEREERALQEATRELGIQGTLIDPFTYLSQKGFE